MFHSDDRRLLEKLIDEISFASVFLTTPDGPCAAHTPLLSSGDGSVRFHLSRSNALAPHLDGAKALITVNGPDGYISPRWYANRDSVSSWDYVALELVGDVKRLADADLEAFLHTLICKHEARLAGEAWKAAEKSAEGWDRLFGMIVGFEMDITDWRPTLKLSQKKTPLEREVIASGLQDGGNPTLARAMRTIAQ